MLRQFALTFFVSLLVGREALAAQKTAPSAAASQEILETLAEPLAATAFTPTLPERFAAWTDQQKKVVPHQIAGRCVVLWGMMNDAGPVPLLPPSLEGETGKLVVAVCVLGKMPWDWPGRKAMLTDAAAIAERSTRLGLALHLPEAVEE